MHSIAATLPLLASILAIAHGHNDHDEPQPYPFPFPGMMGGGGPGQGQGGGQIGGLGGQNQGGSGQNQGGSGQQGPITAFPQPGQSGQQGDGSVFRLTQVPPAPTQAATAFPDKCSETAARITPLLTANPRYPAHVQQLADQFGPFPQDTCEESPTWLPNEKDDKDKDKGKGGKDDKEKSGKEINNAMFAKYRNEHFIQPLKMNIRELWGACGERAGDFDAIKGDNCYKTMLEECKKDGPPQGGDNSFPSFPTGPGDKQNKGGSQGGPKQTGVQEAGAAVTQTVAVGVVGFLTLLWAVLA
ncbi:hypothetical protein N0V88_006268 [Collariella sp. IMI 366227]|nr:hypothetical protein N0V88_006268 [Collariella sp. IMI 366227]